MAVVRVDVGVRLRACWCAGSSRAELLRRRRARARTRTPTSAQHARTASEREQAELADAAPLRGLDVLAKSARAAVLDSARGDRGADAQRGRRPAGGRARGEAEARPAAARQARDRRHVARHPRRPRHPATAHARLPGRGPHGRAHRRRLHDADRRPSGRSAERPILSDEEIDANAQDLPRAGDGRSSTPTGPRCATTASGSSKLDYADVVRLGRTSPSRACSSATTSRSAIAARRADLGLGAAVSADAGLRLGRGRGRRRARRHRPALQPARRAAR